MTLSIIVKAVGILTSLILLISSIAVFAKNKKSKKAKITSAVLLLVALLIPYLMFFHGYYRKNDLKLSENVAEVVSLLEQLDYQYEIDSQTTENEDEIYEQIGEPIFPGYDYLGSYEGEKDGVYLLVDVVEGESPIEDGLFYSRAFISDKTQYDPNKFSAKIESGKNDGCLWTASPLVEYDMSLKTHTGSYDGTFYISKGNKIYICSYWYATKAPQIIIAFTNIRPQKITAVELVNLFLDVHNTYGDWTNTTHLIDPELVYGE